MIYVMSDIHGNRERFDSIMRQINLQKEDVLYILGDVVDRYSKGIGILRQLMKMENVHMLLGNHEHMMLNAIGHCRDAAEEKEKANEDNLRLWYRNGGRVTHEYLLHTRKVYRAEVLSFLSELPANLDVEVNGIKYKLVHGSPVESYYLNRYNMYDYDDEVEYAVWKRWKQGHHIPDGYVLIFGHTPTVHFQNDMPPKIWRGDNAIGIDCGSGYADGRLACLRLDDMQEFSSDF